MSDRDLKGKALVLLLVGGLVGAIVGPPLAQAVSSVTIKGAGSNNKARVNGANRLTVDTEADVVGGGSTGFIKTYAATTPSGEVVLASGSRDKSQPGDGIITGVNLDVLPGSTEAVTLALDVGSKTLWRGSVPADGGNVSYAFENGMYSGSGFDVRIDNPGDADVAYQVYGEGFAVAAAPVRKPAPIR